jgi:hypothetical protein
MAHGIYLRRATQCQDLQIGYNVEMRVLVDRLAIHLEPVWINLRMAKEKSPLSLTLHLTEVIDHLLRRIAVRELWVEQAA